MAETMNEIMRPRERHPDFPNAPAGWTQSSAAEVATNEGLTVGDDHWETVRALQEYFSRHERRDINARKLLDALDEKFHEKGGLKYLYKLFPGGPVAQGCRLAGLEAPAGSTDPGFGSVR
jgi:tRNA 2-thiouridine synthesizing protein E